MARFIDEAVIHVRSGAGGNGCVSFRREKYVPRGGPDGGDGGRGGDVVLVAASNITSLLDFRYKRHYRARRGGHGKGKNMHGASAEPLVVPVPVGTVVTDAETGEVLCDLARDGQRFVAARGGRGGKGNAHFATSTNQAPRYAQPGEPGEERTLRLVLKLLADVGIIGCPNAGKSTLIRRISAARPKVADYPFTTKAPSLGVVDWKGHRFVAADIPGLVEGAHRGVGMGTTFLRHIERTRVLIHLLDLSPYTGRDPRDDYTKINAELDAYMPGLASRPQVVAANKVDLPEAREMYEEIRHDFAERGVELLAVSAATGEGIDELLARTVLALDETAADTAGGLAHTAE